MNDDSRIVFMILLIVLLGITVALYIRRTYKIEAGLVPSGDGLRFKPMLGEFYAFQIPVSFCVVIAAFGTHGLLLFLPVLIILSCYAGLLVIFLPILRKFVSARTCGWLWTLSYVSASVGILGYRNGIVPTLIIPIAIDLTSLPEWLSILWVIGFAAVILWQTVSHFVYKAKLLKHADPVLDDSIIRIWAREQDFVGFEGESLKLRLSPQTQTPLSIGLFQKTTYVILPDRMYSPEELSLIFRHELIHISRRDSINKCFLLFLTAVFWFNPFMWIAMRCCFDDLELSCDESVLQGYDQQTRKKYAELLLSTAGDQRGFTTCLSASAKALRYRLKHTMVPKKKYQGSLLAAFLMILLCMTMIFCGFSYGTETAAEQIFDNRDLGLYTLVDECIIGDDQGITEYPNINLEAVMGYLYQMPVSKLMNEVDVFAGSRKMQLIVYQGEEKFFIGLSTKYLWVRTYPDGEAQDTYYALKEKVDWDTLKSLLNQ